MTVNIGTMTYEVELVTESDAIYNLTPVLLGLEWEEEPDELSRRGTFRVANLALHGTWLHSVAKIGCILSVFSDWGEGRQLVYQGKIWEWKYRSTHEKELLLTTYDNGKYLMQSHDSFYFSSGLSTSSILQTICNTWGIPLQYQWNEEMTHEKKAFHHRILASLISSLLEEVSAHCGSNYVCLWKDDALWINNQGYNSLVFQLDVYRTISTCHTISMNALVTKVKVFGTADDEGRSFVEAEVVGNQEFGLLQHTMTRDSNKTLEDAIAEAEAYLAAHNSPEEEITLVCVDLPFLRKGEKVEVRAGSLVGEYFVLGVCHNATLKQMTLTLQPL